jgi:hypothetical protein
MCTRRVNAVLIFLIALQSLVFAQAPAAGTRSLAPLRAGPVYPPEKPDRSLEVVVDLAPPADLTQKINYEALKSRLTLIEETKPGAQPDEVKAFKDTTRSAAIAIVVDVSNGMAGARLDSVKRGLTRVVEMKRTNDKVALVVFGGDVRLGRDVRVLAGFDSSTQVLQSQIAGLKAESADFPRLYKAVDKALKLFVDVDPKFPARRRLLVVAQGKNPAPDAAGTDAGFPANDVITQALQLQIPIDTIAVPAKAPTPTEQEQLARIVLGTTGDSARADNAATVYLETMEHLASKTGGMYFVDDFRKRTDLGQHLTEGFQWLMNSPVARFPIQNLPFDGGSHAIAVRSGAGGALDMPGNVLLWHETGFQIKKYGLFLLGGLVALIVVLVALQSRRQPARLVRPSMTPPQATPRPGVQASNDSLTPRPPGMPYQPLNPLPGANINRPAPNPGRPRTVPDPAPPKRAGTMVVQSTFEQPMPGRPSCRLTVVSGTHASASFPIEREQSFVGRGPENTIACTFDPAISNPHAEIRFQSGLVLIVDLNSSNGTYLNGERLSSGQPRSLSIGDRIHMGETDFQVN